MWFKNKKCPDCGKRHGEIPDTFASPCPWEDYVPAKRFSELVETTEDQCIINGEIFLIRGHIEIPILGTDHLFVFSVWGSLSEKSHHHISSRWNDSDRENDPPYFGWLLNSIPAYPETHQLKLSVQSRAPGLVPLFTLEPTDHPLAIDQHKGITTPRWHHLATRLLKT